MGLATMQKSGQGFGGKAASGHAVFVREHLEVILTSFLRKSLEKERGKQEIDTVHVLFYKKIVYKKVRLKWSKAQFREKLRY